MAATRPKGCPTYKHRTAGRTVLPLPIRKQGRARQSLFTRIHSFTDQGIQHLCKCFGLMYVRRRNESERRRGPLEGAPPTNDSCTLQWARGNISREEAFLPLKSQFPCVQRQCGWLGRSFKVWSYIGDNGDCVSVE